MNARVRFPQLAGLIEATAVFLFFYQALRVLFSVLCGLIYDALFAETASMTTVGLVLGVVILALLAPLAAPRQPSRRRIALLASAVLVFLARIPLTLNDPQSRLVASILIVAGTGVYLASRLRDGPHDVVRALILALVVDQLLRATGHTWDVTLREGWLAGQVALSVGLCLLAGGLFRFTAARESAVGSCPDLLSGLAWGSWLFLVTSLLAFPQAAARWSGVAPNTLLIAFWAMWGLAGLREIDWLAQRWKKYTGLLDLFFLVGGLALGYWLNGWFALAALALAYMAALDALPAIFLPSRGSREKRLGFSLALGGILFLVLSFAHAFAFTYAYTADFFRGTGVFVCLAAGLVVVLPSWRRPVEAEPDFLSGVLTVVVPVAATMIVLVGLYYKIVQSPWHWAYDEGPLRIATYNIHYGYDTDWHLSLEDQARTIEASGADVVMLQEVDTGRPTSYMIDDAYWLAQRLDMEAIYLPTVEHLTGIALLSRYRIEDSDVLLLPSELEQTGILWAKLDGYPETVNLFAIWLGLEPEERARQLDAALPFLAAHPGPAAFGGDFNSTPDSPVYARIHAAGFVDPFVALGLGSPPTDPAIHPEKRIDFVWLRDLKPLDAQVLDSTASDHRPVVVEAALTE
jgi:endonuclease/exonuclease/phosphatase family metal-dependent hydrolase